MRFIYDCKFSHPVGILRFVEEGHALIEITPVPVLEVQDTPSSLLKEAASQLHEFFRGERREFTIPLAPRGTDFQQKVWSALGEIPYGQTCTYAEIAAKLGKPGGARAVGQANSKNPIPFCIPCHRVVAAGGGLGGYSLGLELKEWLLNLEKPE